MRDTDIPVKTEAGRREIADRRLALHQRQRSMLIAIHGEHSVAELRRQFHTMGDVDALLDDLRERGLIAPAGEADVAPPPPAEPAKAPEADSEPPAPPAPIDEDAQASLQRIRKFMNETAVAALGLRAFLFTLKLEKCYSKEELTELLPEFARVMNKARDQPFATAMVQRATEMLDQA